MAYVEWNPNPVGRKVGDCSIRAISKALGVDWETAYALRQCVGSYPETTRILQVQHTGHLPGLLHGNRFLPRQPERNLCAWVWWSCGYGRRRGPV